MLHSFFRKKLFCPLIVFPLGFFLAGCHHGKGLTGEGGAQQWTLEMTPHPDTVSVGVNDTIFVVVREGEEPRTGISVTFERTLGDSIPGILTVVGDPVVPWGTNPMATFISRDSAGVATIRGTAHGAGEEILARDTITVWIVRNP
jgi:hypothetical protein